MCLIKFGWTHPAPCASGQVDGLLTRPMLTDASAAKADTADTTGEAVDLASAMDVDGQESARARMVSAAAAAEELAGGLSSPDRMVREFC